MKKIYSVICALALFFASSDSSKAYAAETCTLSGVFWMQHLELWPAPFTPDSEICNLTFSEVMQTQSDGTPWYILAHEWIPAQLNIANGAVSECVLAEFEQATALLENCDFAQNPDNISDYLVLTGALADYNNGILIGCPGCPEGTIVICPPCICPQCPACPGCCCPPCPEVPECPKCPDCECGDLGCFCPEPAECACGDCGDCVCPEAAPCPDCNCPDQTECICNCPEIPPCPPAPACNCPEIPPCPPAPACNCTPQVVVEDSSSSSCSSSSHRHHGRNERQHGHRNHRQKADAPAKKTTGHKRRTTKPKAESVRQR